MTLTSKWKEIKFFPKQRIQLIVENLTILISLSIKTIFFFNVKKKKKEKKKERRRLYNIVPALGGSHSKFLIGL